MLRAMPQRPHRSAARDDIGRFEPADRAAWRNWLDRNHSTSTGVWLVFRKGAARQLTYDASVEEALCFGWIDSTQKTLDDDHTAQRYSPRRPGAAYSQPNKERLHRLLAQGRVMDEVREKLPDVSVDGFQIAPDILRALRQNPRVWENFQRYSPSYQRIRIAFVEDARADRPDEFQKRLRNLIEKTEKNRQYGFGIESYH
jgi:uncharacterized protein YdeI (YjbR/CyaY-like superfamily)